MNGSGHHEREYKRFYRELSKKKWKMEKYVGRVLLVLLVVGILSLGVKF